MKRLIFILIQLYFFIQLMGQNKIHIDPYALQKNNALKINVVSPFLATLNLSYEHKLQSKWAVQGGIAYTNFRPESEGRKFTSFKGYQFSFDLRKYLRQNQEWNGWYQEFMGRYNTYNYHYYVQDSTTNNVVIKYHEILKGISLGYVVGYQRTYRNKFLIDIFCGAYISLPTYYKSNPSKTAAIKGPSLEVNPYTNGGGIRTGIKVGYLF